MCSMSVDDDGEDTSGISSFPLGILSNSVHQDSQSSHVTAFNSGHGSSKLDNESTSSNTIRDVHIVRTTTTASCLNISHTQH